MATCHLINFGARGQLGVRLPLEELRALVTGGSQLNGPGDRDEEAPLVSSRSDVKRMRPTRAMSYPGAADGRKKPLERKHSLAVPEDSRFDVDSALPHDDAILDSCPTKGDAKAPWLDDLLDREEGKATPSTGASSPPRPTASRNGSRRSLCPSKSPGDAAAPQSSIQIRGATGPCADVVNGVYRPSTEIVGGRPAFRKEGDEGLWLCFDEEVGQNWKVQRTCDRGSGTGFLHSDGSTADALFPGLALEWRVWDTESFQAQADVSLVLLPPQPAAVTIRGATGPCAGVINGLYQPAAEKVGGRPAFRKDGDADIWLSFDVELGQNWKVQRSMDRGTATGFMHSDGPLGGSALPELATEWKVWDESRFEAQASVSVSLASEDCSDALPSGVADAP
mmetsp:Transcript_122650/g.346791  ORF Transcript_122650/g.346791 Transcript_122650/m.346791 type:complete len:394 (+) Transcript_122650:2-1183(+)